MSKAVNIIVVESSQVVFEGLSSIFTKIGIAAHIRLVGNLDMIEKQFCQFNGNNNIVIVNPIFIQNNIKSFQATKQKCKQAKWIAFVYILHESNLLNLFDGIIRISDSPETIADTVKTIIETFNNRIPNKNEENLSERETEVLQLLAIGMQNKEIADKLNISINTVITHRKNISQKTGIKTVSGLTIYAVIKKLISLNHID